MKIDFDELKRLLTVFLDSPGPFITPGDTGLTSVEGEQQDKLIFHMLLLVENGLISDSKLRTGDPQAIGLVYTSRGIGYRQVNIRLTQDGHDFANALNQQPVLERIKRELADAPFDLVKDVSKQWLTTFIKDKIGLR
ncbi:DUF2513 domain-containing protein [Salmonella enterica subsp. enterica]|nr:DUF2513 domain-containing protein [Salmonella enterica subsp. enterica serovar Isangi]EIK6983657.1 DUF2513 domain-containing protein [Salmonella enterica subsp. enterica serovar Amager]